MKHLFSLSEEQIFRQTYVLYTREKRNNTIYAVTRSTGQIEEGPLGFSVAVIEDDMMSWKFEERGPRPFAMITSLADEKLITNLKALTTSFVTQSQFLPEPDQTQQHAENECRQFSGMTSAGARS